MRDWLRERRYLFVLIAVAALILVIGIRFKPEKPSPEVVLSEADRLRLQMLAQKRSLQSLSRYFSELAARVGTGVVRVEGTRRNGIAWNGAGLIVTVTDRESAAASILTGPGVKVGVTEI